MWLTSIAYGTGKLPATGLVAVLLIAQVSGVALFNANDNAEAEAFCARTPLGQPWPEVARGITESTADQRQSRLYTAPDGTQSA